MSGAIEAGTVAAAVAERETVPRWQFLIDGRAVRWHLLDGHQWAVRELGRSGLASPKRFRE